MLKIWHYLNYKSHLLLVPPAENERVLWTFTDAFGSFRRLRRVVTCYNWASSDAVASLLSADMF